MQLRPLIDNNGLVLDLVTKERETNHNFVNLSLMVSLSVSKKKRFSFEKSYYSLFLVLRNIHWSW